MGNLQIKTDLKKTIKNFKSLIADKNLDEAKSALKNVYKKFDKAVKRNVFQKNTASRRKSFYARLLTSTTPKA